MCKGPIFLRNESYARVGSQKSFEQRIVHSEVWFYVLPWNRGFVAYALLMLGDHLADINRKLEEHHQLNRPGRLSSETWLEELIGCFWIVSRVYMARRGTCTQRESLKSVICRMSKPGPPWRDRRLEAYNPPARTSTFGVYEVEPTSSMQKACECYRCWDLATKNHEEDLNVCNSSLLSFFFKPRIQSRPFSPCSLLGSQLGNK